MELIKLGKDKYLVKNSNGKIINEKERLELENKDLIIKDFESNDCQKETTKKITKNKKRIKELEKENVKINIDLQPMDSKKVIEYIKEQTALQDKENADGVIKETTKKIKKNKNKIKEIMEEEKNNKVEEIETYDEKDIKETANKENADGVIKETISTD